jgi:DnaJ like chaperone protein
MAYKGKLIGALLGSLAGPMGSILGGLIGHLYDQAAEDRRVVEDRVPAGGLPELASGRRPGAPPQPDSISIAQLQFLTVLIGLAVIVASSGGQARAGELEALKAFFREHFPYGPEDQRLLANIVEETFANRERLEVPALCAYYRSVSTPEGRRLLVRLLLKIATSGGPGVGRAEESLVRRIAGCLDIEAAEYRRLAAEFTPQGGWAYRILGLEPAVSDEEVRSAYRRLAAESHPDRVVSLGSEFVRVAEEKFKQLQEAYEEIRGERGF